MKPIHVLKKLRNLIAFLTIIPVDMSSDYLLDAADYMSLFPLVGAFIGSMAGAFGWLLFTLLNPHIAGTLTLGLILLVTGAHHLDGLLDFGDGLMYQGPPEKKIEVMHDQRIGVGGLTLGIITILTTALCIAQLHREFIIQSLIVSEASAKLAMVIIAWIGKSAHKGMNTYFVNAMHGKRRYLHLLVALLTAFGTALFLPFPVGFITMTAGLIVALIIVGISNRHFRGVTGDVFGAGNELARLASLIAILVMRRWM